MTATRLRKRQRRRHRRFRIGDPRWWAWSDLLERVYGEAGWVCPKCRARLVLRAIVLDPVSANRILAGLARSARAPPTGPLWT